ncbi:unnamed protein product [Angiostrongylus costaricensis]|uniref:RING-type domain-containing protein n=1 Tax=Angiostrongylus costaricensis TaxID=334426 RepID=A0A0R3PBR3_ANGCS|nr:unnamed protein product [Angiostrongylus costaricensis]
MNPNYCDAVLNSPMSLIALGVIDGNTSIYCDASEGSSFYHSFDSEDLPEEEEEDIIDERYTDWNAHCVHEVSPSVTEAHESLQSSAPSLEEEEVSTERRRYEQMVDGGNIMVEPSPYLQIECHSIKRQVSEDLARNRLEKEENVIEERRTDWDPHDIREISPSVPEAHESQQSSAPSSEEEISTEYRYEQMVDGGNIIVEPSPYLQIECHLIKRQVSEDLARNRLESLTLTTLCDSNQSEENHARRSSSSSSEKEDDSEESYTDWTARNVREVSPSVAEVHESQESSALSSQEEEISIEHMRNKYPNRPPPEVFFRVKMKNTCISLWGDKVQHLPELLCILKMCHHIYGPLSITSCEEVIESCFNPDGERSNWSLMKDGGRTDVKRMFELKMFQLSKPPNRMEVQPVDCILKSKFRMLPKGLISEVYKALLKSKKGKAVKEIMEMMTPFLKANDDFSRLDEIKEAILTVPDVIRINNDYLELSNDDAFFVITDQII